MRKQSVGVAIALAAIFGGSALAATNISPFGGGDIALVRANGAPVAPDAAFVGAPLDLSNVKAAVHDAAFRELTAREAAALAARRAEANRAAASRAAASRASRSSRAARGAVVVAGDDVWARLRQCESGGNYAANTGNGYYGAYQFSASTWRSMGTGYAYAHEAPPAVQDDAARRLQARSGWGQWPACSRKLGLR